MTTMMSEFRRNNLSLETAKQIYRKTAGLRGAGLANRGFLGGIPDL